MSAEGGVDAAVQDAFFPIGTKPGVLVEVGAAHPEYLSIGNRFRAQGWRVISIEPNPVFCDEYRKRNLSILQFACSDHDNDDGVFIVVRSKNAEYYGGQVTYESFSSLEVRGKFAELRETVETEAKEIPVVVRRLDRVLKEFAPDVHRIDILSVDVEGWEIDVMRGFNIAHYRPKIVILENVFDEPEYRDYMVARGYLHWKTIAPNEIYARPLPQKFKRGWLGRYLSLLLAWATGSRPSAASRSSRRP